MNHKADCCSDGGHDAPSLPLEAARERILGALAPVAGVQRVALGAALGRVLARPVHAGVAVPAHDNSAMDGYAVRSADLGVAGGELRVAGRVLAGEAWSQPLESGTCLRIMTGAPIPEGADTVVMQEHVEVLEADRARFPAGVQPGANVRAAGEDLSAGAEALGAGHRLRPQEIGVIGSLGIPEVWVRRRPTVAFFSTGDELRSAGETLAPGAIYDSNRHMLAAALRRLGVEIHDMGVVGDDFSALKAAFEEAGSVADALVTTGGVSVGEADHVKEAIEATGSVDLWRIAMRPGRPLAFGRVGGATFFGLPGNPVSVAATFYQVVQPALRRMMGESGPLMPVLLPAVAATAMKKRSGRSEFQRGIMEQQADGSVQVRPTGAQGSGMLTSMVKANCLIALEEDREGVAAGETVRVQPLEGLQL